MNTKKTKDTKTYVVNESSFIVTNSQLFTDEVVTKCLESLDLEKIGDGMLAFCDDFENRIYMLIETMYDDTPATSIYLVDMYSEE